MDPAPVRNRGLDALRGFAVLWVIGYHYYGLRPLNPWIDAVPGLGAVLSAGWLGVAIFFGLSGYLITTQLVASRGQPDYWRQFFVKRAARIVPAYALLLLSLPVAFALWPADRAGPVFNHEIPFWSHALLVQNAFMAHTGYLGNEWLRATWSLAVEVQYYVFVALFVALCPPRWLGPALGLLVLLALVARFAMTAWLADPSAPMMVLTVARLDSFALGGLVALIPSARWTRAHAGVSAVLALLCTGAFVAYSRGAWGQFTVLGRPTYYTLVAGATAGVVALLAPAGAGRSWPGSAALAAIGQRSYFLYLFHMPVLWICHELLRQDRPGAETGAKALVGAIALVVVFALAWLSWASFEAPVLIAARQGLARRH